MGTIPLCSCLLAICCWDGQAASAQNDPTSNQSSAATTVRKSRTALKIKNGRFLIETRENQNEALRGFDLNFGDFSIDCRELEFQSTSSGDATIMKCVGQDAQFRIGNVWEGRADRLMYDSKLQRMKLSGKVQVNYRSREKNQTTRITAAEMTIDLHPARIQVRGVNAAVEHSVTCEPSKSSASVSSQPTNEASTAAESSRKGAPTEIDETSIFSFSLGFQR